MISLSILSVRVRELCELVTMKNSVLLDLMRKAGVDWMNSQFASLISFNRTRILQFQNTIKDLLKNIDNIAYAVACLNGTHESYVLRSGVEVVFDKQRNYVCMLEPASTPESLNPRRIKQRSDPCYKVSTIYRAIGLGLLREKQAHYDKVLSGNKP